MLEQIRTLAAQWTPEDEFFETGIQATTADTNSQRRNVAKDVIATLAAADALYEAHADWKIVALVRAYAAQKAMSCFGGGPWTNATIEAGDRAKRSIADEIQVAA